MSFDAMARGRMTDVCKTGAPGTFLAGLIVWALLLSTPGPAAPAAGSSRIELELSPRVCSLSARDEQCDTVVRARWSAQHEESLCLLIVDHPDVQQCWEHYEAGTYTVELMFARDLTFELRDPALQQILASEVLRVIREAILYRHKRRQPWNIFD